MSFFDVAWWILVVLYVPACVGLIVIVLLQKGKGTGFAGAFGMGAGSDTVFGPRSRQSLPVRLTYVAATLFMVIALLMSIIAGRVGKGIAPELVEEVALESSLTDLGIGTGGGGAFTEPARGTEDGSEQEEPGLDIVIRAPSSAGARSPAGAGSPAGTGAAADADSPEARASGGTAPGGNVSGSESSDGPESSGTPYDGAS